MTFLVTLVDQDCVYVDARCCVLCRELDLVTLKRIFEVGTLSRLETGIHKVAGNHAGITHMVSSIGFRTCELLFITLDWFVSVGLDLRLVMKLCVIQTGTRVGGKYSCVTDVLMWIEKCL